MSGISDAGRFRRAIEAIDAANSEDPNRESAEGREWPKELLYAVRMSRWLEKLVPQSPEELQLAVRAQHLRRWTLERSRYPMDRTGYLKWRTDLKNQHAREAGEILKAAGYEDGTVGRVQQLIRKEGLMNDPEAQALEDAACLVFLQYHFAEFASRHDEEKILDILRKTWKKMSPHGRKQAESLLPEMNENARGLIEKALSEKK